MLGDNQIHKLFTFFRGHLYVCLMLVAERLPEHLAELNVYPVAGIEELTVHLTELYVCPLAGVEGLPGHLAELRRAEGAP